jgi:RTX calcium-binding nonapeptide repeat (4 copies)
VIYQRATPVIVSIGDGANDGAPGEHDDVQTDVENVTGGAGDDTLTGDAGANRIDGGGGNDVISGGPGQDTLVGGDGNDTIHARDGELDTIECGNGADTVDADPADVVSLDCDDTPPPPPSGAAPPPDGVGTVTLPRDLTPPTLTIVALPRMRLASLLKRGVKVTVRCSESCSLRTRLFLVRPVARTFHLGSPMLSKAGARLTQPGQFTLTLTLPVSVRRHLRRAKSLTLDLETKAADAVGNATVNHRRLRVTR